MALVMFLPGIPGECDIDGYKKWHVTAGFTWGGSRTLRSQAARGMRGETKVSAPQLRNIAVRRLADGHSASLWQQMFTRREFDEVKFEWLRTGAGKPVSYFSAAFRLARIISISAVSEGAKPVEEIAFLYKEVTIGVTNVGNRLTGAQDIVTYSVPTNVLA
jgi:type VI protein secretion system component Hcp